MSDAPSCKVVVAEVDYNVPQIRADHRWWLALPHRATRWIRLSPPRRRLAIEVLVALVVARVWLVLRPFKTVAARLGTPLTVGEFASVAPSKLDEDQAAQAREVAMMVRWIARFVPFRAVCLQQAVAAKTVLARRHIPSVLHFGVLRQAEGGRARIRAHAWLAAGTVEVTGFEFADKYQEIARFV
jgi:hypothetical protein